MDIWKIISDIKDWFVKDNFGLHLCLAYITFINIVKINTVAAFVVTVLLIILMEIIDKYKIKTKFSFKDILAGFIGIALAYISHTYL